MLAGWVTVKVEKPQGKWHGWWGWEGQTVVGPRAGPGHSAGMGSSEGSPRLSRGLWTGLTWSDLSFTKTILLREELRELRRATPMIIYNDMISPGKHRLTLQGKKKKKKKLGKLRGFLCIHSFNPPNHPRTARRLFPFDRQRNWGTEMWRLCSSLVTKLRFQPDSLQSEFEKTESPMLSEAYIMIMSRAREESAGLGT